MHDHYDSFLIRWWRPEEGVTRIKVEHIQSGEGAAHSSLEASLAWVMQQLANGGQVARSEDGLLATRGKGDPA